MKIEALKKIKSFIFGRIQLAQAFRINRASAAVTCNRYVRRGLLIRAKRDIYVIKDRWDEAPRSCRFTLANRLQVPSYISLTTALSYYELTTQVQQDFFECIAIKKSNEVEVGETHFRYFKIQPSLYCGYVKREDFFIALPEKALLDALYLQALGRYHLDTSSLEYDKFDRRILNKLLKHFPQKMKGYVKRYAPIS